MQDIYLDNIKLHNVRCHTDMEMDFPVGLTVIKGKNGSGKSTITKSISMALYGDSGDAKGKRLEVADMVNEKAKGNLEIILNFRIIENNITDKYEIQLYQDHKKFRNKMILLKNGIDISQKSKTETYKFIEKLLIPRDLYHNIIYFNQQVKDFFTSLNNSEQKEIFDSILSLEDYNTYYKNTSDILKDLEIKQTSLNSDISNLMTNISVKQNQTLQTLISAKNNAIESNKKSLSDLITKKTDKEKELKESQFNITKIKFDQIQFDSLNNSKASLTEKKNGKLQQLQKDLSVIESEKSKMLDVLILTLKSKFSNKQSEFKSKFDQVKKGLDSQLKDLLVQQAEIEKKYSTYHLDKEYQDKISETQKEIRFINDEISKLESEFTTKVTELEKDSRLKIIDKNIQEVKDKASKLKEEAGSIKSLIDSKQTETEKDESALNQKVSICSKCLRPFSSSEKPTIIQESINKAKEEIQHYNSKLDELKKVMIPIKSSYEEYITLKTKTEKDYNDQINSILLKKADKNNILIRKRDLINKEIEQIKDDINQKKHIILSAKSDSMIDIDTKKIEIESNIQTSELELNESISELDNSLTIESENIKQEQNKKYTILVSDLKQKSALELQDYDKQIYQIENDIKNLVELQEKQINIKNYISSLNFEITSFNSRITELMEFKYDDSSIQKIELEIKEHQLEFEKLNTQRNSIIREIKILEFWKESFSDSGIKSMLIDMAIPHLNSAVSNALDRVTPGVFTVSFDTLKTNKSGDIKDKFNINILHNTKGTNSYKKLSGGEARLLDICCMEALNSLSEKLYGKRFHNLFLDEILDSLDDDITASVGQALKILSSDKNITLIAHKATESVEPDRMFTF